MLLAFFFRQNNAAELEKGKGRKIHTNTRRAKTLQKLKQHSKAKTTTTPTTTTRQTPKTTTKTKN